MDNNVKDVISFKQLKKLNAGNSIRTVFIFWVVLAQLGIPFASNFINKHVSDITIFDLPIGVYLASFMNVIILTIIITILIKIIILDRIKELINFTEKVSKGDLSERLKIDKSNEITMLGQGINLMVDSLADTIKENTQSTEKVDEIAEKLDFSTNTISETMEGIAEKSQSMDENIQEINSVITSVNEETFTLNSQSQELAAVFQQIAASSTNTENIVFKGKESTDEVVNEVMNTRTTFEELENQSNVLNQKSKEMSNIIEVINKLANQTSILALNAKIESAQAGEKGKGFAVVADEIRQLANDTAVSIGAVETIINEIQFQISTLNNNTESVNDALNRIESISGQSHSILDEVTKETSIVNEMIQEVAAANEDKTEFIKKISDTLDNINSKINYIKTDMETTTSLIEETTQSAEEISDSTSNLKDSTTETKNKMLKIKL